MGRCLILRFLSLAIVLPAFSTENLFVHGDFSEAKPDLSPDCGTNGGRVSLYQEEGSWNKCGVLEITKSRTETDGSETISACALIGGDGKALGIPVKGDTLYEFSIEIRSDVDAGSSIKFQDWHTGVWGSDSKIGKTSVGGFHLKKDWSLYKGTFRTHPGATRAVLAVNMWTNSKYPPLHFKVGDRLYFDNVKISEAAEDAREFLKGGGKVKVKDVFRRKATKSGLTFDDFAVVGAARELGRTTGVVTANDEGLTVVLDCEEPDGMKVGTKDDVWSGDSFEVFFGPAPDGAARLYTQLAWNTAGGVLVNVGMTPNPVSASQCQARTKETATGFRTGLRIPYSVLGFARSPKDGDTILLNVCRSRAAKRTWCCWAPVKERYNEVDRFGRFVFGKWDDALKTAWGDKGGSATSRKSFEDAWWKAEVAKRDERYAKLTGRPFTVAAVSVDSEYSCPFTPPESFDPPDRIVVKSAVNERKGVPVAILNLTDRTEEYIVRLEDRTTKYESPDARALDGGFGLRGLDPKRITIRKALRFKDTDQDPTTVFLDPLPKMDEALSLQVPPKEAGIVWIDFDLEDVKPGVYDGRLRVIPLSEAAKLEPYKGAFQQRVYKGEMQDVPLSLEVRPIALPKVPSRPFGFFTQASARPMMELMREIGTVDYQFSPWRVSFSYDPKTGKMDLDNPTKASRETQTHIRNQLAWGRELGISPTFFMGFSCFDTCVRQFGVKDEPLEKKLEIWKQYLRGVNKITKEAGLSTSDYVIEAFDEPPEKDRDTIIAVHRAAKEAVPDARIALTLGATRMSLSAMEKMAPEVDVWILYGGYYFDAKEFRDFNAHELAAGKKVYHYMCSTSARIPIYSSYRLHPWFGEFHKLSGNYMFWFMDMIGPTGMPDFKVTTFGGIAYRNYDAFIPSLRYMSMRQGVNDLLYLDALRELVKEDNAMRTDPEIMAFLESAGRTVMVDERHDKTAPDRMRERAAELILKCRSAL